MIYNECRAVVSCDILIVTSANKNVPFCSLHMYNSLQDYTLLKEIINNCIYI